MHLSRLSLSVAGGTVLLLAGATAVYAATTGSPIDNSGVIHACYGKESSSGAFPVELQDAGMSCSSKTTSITWNQQGPQGPQGSQGPAGVANLERGYVSFTTNGTPGGTTCSGVDVAGPLTISVAGGIPANDCEISGLPPGSVITVTPLGPLGEADAQPFGAVQADGTVDVNVQASTGTGAFAFMVAIPGP